MLVLAAVPDVQFHKLRRAAGSRFNVAQVSTWDDVLTSIRGRPVELAVVDPLLSGQGRSQEIERLRVLFPSLPLMLYTTLTPRTAGVLLALGQRGIQHAVFANYDDHPSRLREVLGSGASASPSWSRSEEHTSELQSHSDLVCRLLLEKKKPSGRGAASTIPTTPTRAVAPRTH